MCVHKLILLILSVLNYETTLLTGTTFSRYRVFVLTIVLFNCAKCLGAILSFLKKLQKINSILICF